MAKHSAQERMPEPVQEQTPEPVSALPSGVFMHNGDGREIAFAQLAARKVPTPKEPKRPPPGWAGGYTSCGLCGSFLGDETACIDCFPHSIPNNAHIQGDVKC